MTVALASLGVGLAALAESSGSSSTKGSSPTNRHAAGRTVSVTLPNVLGQSETQAVTSLEAVGFRTLTLSGVANAPVGTVFVESPGAGASVRPRSLVSLTVADGPIALPASAQPQSSTIVPNVVEIFQQSVNDTPAIRALEGHELKWKTTGVYVGPNGRCGDLVAQSPPAGTRVAVWSDVLLTYDVC